MTKYEDYYNSWKSLIDMFPASMEGDCGRCYECLNTRKLPSGLPLTASMMVLCPDCGNKRCPRATHHDNDCTGSNDTGQEGSRYA